jgi:hypothetical protein
MQSENLQCKVFDEFFKVTNKIKHSGDVSTFASSNTGLKYPRGIVMNHKEQVFFVADPHAIFKITS